MTTRFGQPVAVTSHSGYFWLTDPTNPEVVVKLFDGSGDNGFFHVTWGGTTDFGLTLRVTDLCSGAVETYTNPLGTTAATTTDTMAFQADDCDVFSDGFESGDTAAWSSTVPGS